MVKISIVVPAYNQAQYIEDCLNSVLGQSVAPHEIIVVNDGSTDNTAQVLNNFPSIIVVNQVNKGLSSARNTGIMNATGDYILPLDADDMLKPDALKVISETIGRTGADIVSPSFNCFGESNDQVILMVSPKLEDFMLGNRVGYCSAIRKEVLLEVGGYSPRMWAGYEDLHLWFNLLTRGKKIVTIQEPLWEYRVKKHSMIHDSIRHHAELMAQIAKDFPQIKFNEPIRTPLPQ